jgi:hypothetical protein
MKITRLLAGTALTAAALVGLPLTAQAVPAGVHCEFTGAGTDNRCAVLFSHGGGTVAVRADIRAATGSGLWFIVDKSTGKTVCREGIDAVAPVGTWFCQLPSAGDYQFTVLAVDAPGAPGNGVVQW